jgi:Cu/Ag efflux pump CusA
MAAEEVEQRITIPLEREINGTPGLLLMRSKSTFGLSLITVVFRDGIEDYWSRQRLLERIQNAVLPPGLSPGLAFVAGWLLMATLLTLFLVPTFYFVVERRAASRVPAIDARPAGSSACRKDVCGAQIRRPKKFSSAFPWRIRNRLSATVK